MAKQQAESPSYYICSHCGRVFDDERIRCALRIFLSELGLSDGKERCESETELGWCQEVRR